MITKISGKLKQIDQETLSLAVDAFEYTILIPEFTRRQLQNRQGEDICLHTIQSFTPYHFRNHNIFNEGCSRFAERFFESDPRIAQ